MKQYMRRIPKTMYAILALSFLLHIVFFITNPGVVFNNITAIGLPEEYAETGGRDGYLYVRQANQLLNEGVYGFDTHKTGEVTKNAFVTPGYPLYLTVNFAIADILHVNQLVWTKLVNMILSVGTVFLLYAISVRLFNKHSVGLVAAFLYATYFTPLHFFRTMYMEVSAMFFFSLAFYMLLVAIQENKARYHIAFGVLACVAFLFRATTAPLILLAIGVVVWKFGIKESFKIGLYWLIGPFITFLPWVIRNWLSVGYPYLFSSHAGNSLMMGTIPYGIEEGNELYKEMYSLNMDQKEYAYFRMKRGFEEQFNLWFSWFTMGKTYVLFSKVEGWLHYQNQWYLKFFFVQHLVVVCAAFITGIGNIIFAKNKKVLAITAVVVGYILLSNMFLTLPRYGFFIIPFMCILGAYGIVWVMQRVCSLLHKQ